MLTPFDLLWIVLEVVCCLCNTVISQRPGEFYTYQVLYKVIHLYKVLNFNITKEINTFSKYYFINSCIEVNESYLIHKNLEDFVFCTKI